MQGLLGKTSCNNYHFVIKFLRDTDLAKRISFFFLSSNISWYWNYLLISPTPAQSVAVNAPLSWFANRQKTQKKKKSNKKESISGFWRGFCCHFGKDVSARSPLSLYLRFNQVIISKYFIFLDVAKLVSNKW